MYETTVITDLSEFLAIKKPENLVPHAIDGIAIKEYTLDGDFVRMWNNISQVSKGFNVPYSTIRSCLKGNLLQIKGRIFLKVEDNIEDRLALIKEEQLKENLRKSVEEEYKKCKEIKVYTSSGEFLRTCTCINEVASMYGISRANIQNHLYGNTFVTQGLVFIGGNQTIEERLKNIKNRKTWKHNV